MSLPAVGLVLSVAATVTLLALNLSGPPGTAGSLNGYGFRDIYAWHPVMMSLAFLFCFPVAMLAYVLDSPPALVAAYLPDKRARRVLHGACNLAGTLLTVSGFVLAFTYHEALGKPHAGLNEPAWHQTLSRPAHIIIGYMVVIAIFGQCVAGLVKFVQRDGPAPPPAGGPLSYHGLVGPAVWLLGLLCIALALYFEYLEVPPPDAKHWNLVRPAARARARASDICGCAPLTAVAPPPLVAQYQILVAGALMVALAATVLVSLCRPRAAASAAVEGTHGLLNGDYE